MKTKIQKWGNSLGLRIPKSSAMEAQLDVGSVVEISVENGSLRIRAVRPRKYRLNDLVKGIRPDNLHGEVSTEDAVGRELW